MKKKIHFAFFTLLFSGMALASILYLLYGDIAVLNPKGIIALEESNLIIISTLLMLIVVIPVFILSFIVAWKYRAGNKKAKYDPDWDHSTLAESIWWGVPFAIVIVLSIITWKSSHTLDPFKPIKASTKPITIQVVALQWKWLFIYPEQNIATVNFFQFPEKTPVSFEITADAPMNSFWIPQLSGQVFAMPGMKTKLHLMADEVGSYRGSSANISGKGFAGMTFVAKSSTQTDFDTWVESVKQSPHLLSLDAYKQLATPSENNPVASYVLTREDLYNWIVMKYMMPMKE